MREIVIDVSGRKQSWPATVYYHEVYVELPWKDNPTRHCKLD
jgi:hypothetical protein